MKLSEDQVRDCHLLPPSVAGWETAVQVIPSVEVMIRSVPLRDPAANIPRSGDQARALQVMPSGLVITRLVPISAIATNMASSGDQTTSFHALSSAVLSVQLIPSGLVITWVVLQQPPTDTNMASAGDQTTELHENVPGTDLVVQVIPSGLLEAPFWCTATSKLSSGDQAKPWYTPDAIDLAVQLIPSGEVIMRFVPL